MACRFDAARASRAGQGGLPGYRTAPCLAHAAGQSAFERVRNELRGLFERPHTPGSAAQNNGAFERGQDIARQINGHVLRHSGPGYSIGHRTDPRRKNIGAWLANLLGRTRDIESNRCDRAAVSKPRGSENFCFGGEHGIAGRGGTV